MDHIRVGGVCLLLLVIAAALPISVLAQSQQADAGSASGSDATAQGAAPTISKSVVSESIKSDRISAESLSKRNAGLKPLGSSSQPASSASEQTAQTASPQASAATTESTATESATTENAAESPATVSTDTKNAETESAATTEDAAAQETTVTPDTIQTEETTTPTADQNVEAVAAGESTATAQEESVVTPPEDAALGTAVSANETGTETAATENTTEVAAEQEEPPAEETAAEEEQPAAINRIWTEGDPDPYTWDYRIFSGFFYDMENNVGTERLTIDLDGNSRSVAEGDLLYTTSSEPIEYEFEDWGWYQVIGFMADKYFAGYIEAEDEESLFDQNVSLLNEGQLRKVLIDTDDESTITTGSVLTLEEGYELQIKQIDIDGNKVYLGLTKDGDEIDSKVVSPESSLKSATYEYKVEISGEDVPIIMAHISNVFASTESDLVTVDGLFQLSDSYSSVENGDEYDKMKVTDVSDEGVEMENDNTITLRKGDTTEIFGDVGFIVADADVLRFAPIVERTGPQEVRGTVINPSEVDEFTWTPYNFEGFYYDIDDDVGTEELKATISGGTKIEEGDLTYRTSPQAVEFEFDSWGKYDVIGFMADKYFAGYNNLTKFADEARASMKASSGGSSSTTTRARPSPADRFCPWRKATTCASSRWTSTETRSISPWPRTGKRWTAKW